MIASVAKSDPQGGRTSGVGCVILTAKLKNGFPVEKAYQSAPLKVRDVLAIFLQLKIHKGPPAQESGLPPFQPKKLLETGSSRSGILPYLLQPTIHNCQAFDRLNDSCSNSESVRAFQNQRNARTARPE